MGKVYLVSPDCLFPPTLPDGFRTRQGLIGSKVRFRRDDVLTEPYGRDIEHGTVVSYAHPYYHVQGEGFLRRALRELTGR